MGALEHFGQKISASGVRAKFSTGSDPAMAERMMQDPLRW